MDHKSTIDENTARKLFESMASLPRTEVSGEKAASDWRHWGGGGPGDFGAIHHGGHQRFAKGVRHPWMVKSPSRAKGQGKPLVGLAPITSKKPTGKKGREWTLEILDALPSVSGRGEARQGWVLLYLSAVLVSPAELETQFEYIRTLSEESIREAKRILRQIHTERKANRNKQ
jgi:hypothetical protein